MGKRLSQAGAILYKSLFLQMRQRKTNCAQCCVPCVFFLFFGYFNLQFAIFSINMTSIDLQKTNEWAYNTRFGEVPGQTYWMHGYFSDGSPDSAGSLGNGTTGAPAPSGMLAWIHQTYFTDTSLQRAGHIEAVKNPWFEEYDSANDVDEQFYDAAVDELAESRDDEQDPAVVPNFAINFNTLDFEKGKLDYTVQWDPNEDDYWDILPSYLPPDYDPTKSNTDIDEATPHLAMSLIDSAFASEVFNRNVTIMSNAANMISNQTVANTFNFIPLLGFICIPPALTFMLPVIVFQFVLEKSHGQLEMAKLKGLSITVYWIANFIFYYIFYLMPVTIAVLSGWLVNAEMIVDSWTVTVPLFLVWGFCMIALGALFSTIFTSERNATILSYVVVFLSISAGICLNVFVFPTKAAPWWYHLFPPLTFVRGVFIIQNSFVNFTPIQWTKHYDPEILNVIIIMLAQTVVMTLLSVYMEFVMPRKFGKSEPMLFPILWIYYKIRPPTDEKIELDNVVDEFGDEQEDCRKERLRVLENDDPSKFTLACHQMRKEYGTNVALKSFCLGVARGECFGLLGPNGAGKTTLISSLCGMNTPTSGFALIDGHNTISEMSSVRQVLGYCPQHDILWDDLTIREHINFFFRLTGVPKGLQLHVAVMNVIESVGLQDHMHKKASELSGGMKRRLSIANALVGNPKLLLLDEPTTGLDPESRREIWDIIADAGRDRSTLVSTHNMEEADVLCSRIGIMSRGRLVCVGNQQYLKSRFGGGYSLTATVERGAEPAFQDFVKQLFPRAELDSSYAGMLSFLIPTEEIDISRLFSEMSRRKQDLRVKEWGVNQSSLEEVFLRIVRRDEGVGGAAEEYKEDDAV